jgi:hypothetical protein
LFYHGIRPTATTFCIPGRRGISLLTRINIAIDFRLDTVGVILLVSTGGVGYLAREFYDYFSTKEEKSIQLQSRNLNALLDEAVKKGASSLRVSLHPKVPIIVPSGCLMNYIERTPGTDTVEFSFKHIPGPGMAW